jgi:hypothetical protein
MPDLNWKANLAAETCNCACPPFVRHSNAPFLVQARHPRQRNIPTEVNQNA